MKFALRLALFCDQFREFPSTFSAFCPNFILDAFCVVFTQYFFDKINFFLCVCFKLVDCDNARKFIDFFDCVQMLKKVWHSFFECRQVLVCKFIFVCATIEFEGADCCNKNNTIGFESVQSTL